MSDELNTLRNQLTTWYMSLDQRTQGFFEAAYAQAPEAVTQAIGGQAVVASREVSEYATLAAMLAADTGGDITTVVPYLWAEAPTVDAAEALVPFKVHWTDRNYGADSSGHVDELGVFDQSNVVVYTTIRDVQGLGKGAEAALEVEVPGLHEGTYAVRIHHNAKGRPVEEAAYASRELGISSVSEKAFEIGKGALDYELVRVGNERMQPLSSAAQNSHHVLLADAIETYVRAFGRNSEPYTDELSAIFQVTAAARAVLVSKDAVFAGTSSAAGAVVNTGNGVLSGQATARQLLGPLNAVTGALRQATAGATAQGDDVDEHEYDTPSPAPTVAAPVTAPVAKAASPTISLGDLSSHSYTEGDTGEKDPYFDLSKETSGDATPSESAGEDEPET